MKAAWETIPLAHNLAQSKQSWTISASLIHVLVLKPCRKKNISKKFTGEIA